MDIFIISGVAIRIDKLKCENMHTYIKWNNDHILRNLNFYLPVVALSIMVFSMFLLMVLVILSLLVTIFFFCSFSGADRAAGSMLLDIKCTILAEFALGFRFFAALLDLLHLLVLSLILH